MFHGLQRALEEEDHSLLSQPTHYGLAQDIATLNIVQRVVFPGSARRASFGVSPLVRFCQEVLSIADGTLRGQTVFGIGS